MTSFNNLTWKKLNFEHVETLLDWAREEGWNPGPHDAKAYWHADPDGFYGYVEGDDLIAGGAIISYSGLYGFMGLFIVRKDYRGNGLGRKLWNKRRDLLLERLLPKSSIGMDGVVEMQSFYQRGGFEIAFRDMRYEFTGASYSVDPRIKTGNYEVLNKILEYDETCFGAPRDRFLKYWIDLPDSQFFTWFEGGFLKGYAIIRKAYEGFKVCPLFADNPEIAEELFKACLNAVNGQKLYIDVPETQHQAVSMVDHFGGKYVFECARMYHGTPPSVPMEKIFGLTTFEIG